MLRPHPLIHKLQLPAKLPYSPRKPYIPDEGWENKHMTIVAGFRCENGVVLAADTLITFEGGTGKKYESKIFTVNQDLELHLTYTGDPDFAKELVQQLKEVTIGKTEQQALSLVKETYRKLYREHYTEPPKNEKTWVWALITLREGSRVSLYSAKDRHFTKIDSYTAFGIGQDQAEALFNPLYRSFLSIDETSFMARYALHRVKNFVQGCGGETEVRALADDRSFSFLSLRSKEVEEDFDFFDRQILTLLLSFPDLGVTKKTYRASLKAVCGLLEKYRDTKLQKQARDIREFMRD